MKKVLTSIWEPEKCRLTTKLKGPISLDDVQQWKAGLSEAAGKIDRPFKFIFDNYNFQANSMEVHRAYRDFVPRLLAKHGLVMSLLTEEEKEVVAQEYDETLPACRAMALIHHDRYKMETLDQEFGTQNQRYFYNGTQARNWIDHFHLDHCS